MVVNSYYKSIAYELPYELPNNLILCLKSGNIRTMSKLGGDRAKHQVFLPEIKLL